MTSSFQERERPRSARVGRVMGDALKALAVLLVWVGLIEVTLRVTHMPVTGAYSMRDFKRAFRFRPGAHYWFETEGWNEVRYNSLGFQDVERSLQREPGTLRLAFLGSSYVQSAQFPAGKAFPAVAARELKAHGHLAVRDVEGLNFGVGAYGLPQQLITLQDDVWKYDPQIVIEVIGLYNDIVNNDRYTSVSGRTYPYYTVQNGRLVPDEITRRQQVPPDPHVVKWEGRWGDLVNHSKILQFVNRDLHVALNPPDWQPGLIIDPRQTSTFFPPNNPHLQNAWDVTETSLRMMRDECAAHHAEFWVVVLDFNLQSDPDRAAKARQLKDWGITDMHYPDRRIVEFSRKEGIHTFWLAPLLIDYAESHGAALHGFFNTPRNFGHYNALGQQVIGRLIADELLRNSDALKAGRELTQAHK